MRLLPLRSRAPRVTFLCLLAATLLPAGFAAGDEEKNSTWDWAADLIVDSSRRTAGETDRTLATRALFTLSLDADTGPRAAGRTVAHASYWRLVGRTPTPLTGLLQPLSGIDSSEIDLLGEAWIEHTSPDEALRVKLGQIDAATEFGALPGASSVIAAPAGAAPTLPVIPTYPAAALGAMGSLRLGATGYVSAGTFGESIRQTRDGLFPSPYSIVELGLDGAAHPRAYRVFAGAWRKRGDFERLDGATTPLCRGWYAGAETRLWVTPGADGEPVSGATLFVQFGSTDEDLSEATRHFAAGLHWLGWIPARPADVTGVYASRVFTSRAPGSNRDAHEDLVEVVHHFSLDERWTVSPAVQWVRHAGGDASAPDTAFLTLRIACSL